MPANREQLAVLDAVVERSPLAMAITVGAAHTLRAASPAFRQLLRSAPPTPGSGCIGDRLGTSLWAGVQPLLDRVFASGVAEVAADLEDVDPARGTRAWTYAVWPVNGPDGRVDGLILQASETTAQEHTQQRDAQTGRELRAVNEQLLLAGLREQAARDEAEAALAVRNQFLAVASHELRTPLTSLLGYAHLVARIATQGPDAVTALGARIVGQVQRLKTLIEQLLDVSHLQRGQFAVALQPLDLAALTTRIVDEFRSTLPAEAEHHVTLIVPAAAVMVAGDTARLEAVLLNLLSNAVKYSPAGGTVAVRVAQEDASGVLEVVDAGIGIPAAAQARLFEPYFRAGNAGEQASGFGLGLYIVHEIVQHHGGRIRVTSAEGQGSTFGVTLPLVEPSG